MGVRRRKREKSVERREGERRERERMRVRKFAPQQPNMLLIVSTGVKIELVLLLPANYILFICLLGSTRTVYALDVQVNTEGMHHTFTLIPPPT